MDHKQLPRSKQFDPTEWDKESVRDICQSLLVDFRHEHIQLSRQNAATGSGRHES